MGSDPTEMSHEKVEFGQRRPTIALPAFRTKAKLSGHHQRVIHRLRVQWVAPSRPSDCENGTKVAEIISHRLRLDRQLLGEVDQFLAADLAALEVRNIKVLYGCEDLSFGAADFPDGFLNVAVDYGREFWVRHILPLNRA